VPEREVVRDSVAPPAAADLLGDVVMEPEPLRVLDGLGESPATVRLTELEGLRVGVPVREAVGDLEEEEEGDTLAAALLGLLLLLLVEEPVGEGEAPWRLLLLLGLREGDRVPLPLLLREGDTVRLGLLERVTEVEGVKVEVLVRDALLVGVGLLERVKEVEGVKVLVRDALLVGEGLLDGVGDCAVTCEEMKSRRSRRMELIMMGDEEMKR